MSPVSQLRPPPAPPYNAKGATAVYDAEFMTCSGVSCHGGGAGDPELVQRAGCREQLRFLPEPGSGSQDPQFNSYFSGKHDFHVDFLGLPCIQCHIPAKLNRAETPNHFSGLATPEFEQDPATTLLDALNYDPDPQFPTCTTNLVGCHGGQERSW